MLQLLLLIDDGDEESGCGINDSVITLFQFF
jgi:hypothetical protein